MLNTRKVDIAINVYGKPLQTAVTLLSLLKHSGQWIDKIYFIEERKQPHNTKYDFILNQLGDRVIYYKPLMWWWVKNQMKWQKLLKLPFLRHSIRYQYAWEKSDKDFLLIIHNDVYFSGDLVKYYLDNIEENNTGIGNIGQCWNCPASAAGKCNGESFTKYRPDHKELVELFNAFPPPEARKDMNEEFLADKVPSWPLPECRLNEYVALINLKLAKPLAWPAGPGAPVGLFNFELGVQWFRDMAYKGYYPKHLDFGDYATHGWASAINSGHGALFNDNIYFDEEEKAKKVLESEFNIVFDKTNAPVM